MNKVLNKIQDVNPNDTDAVKDAVSTFFSNLSNYTETDCFKWLYALGKVLNRFPKFCAPHRNTIEKYLVHFLDSSNYRNVIEAAKCAHTLQQVRPSLDKAATPKACWREQMLMLCNAAHALIEILFANSISIHKKSSNSQRQETHVLADTPLTKALSNITKANKTESDTSQGKKAAVSIRLRNVFVFLQAMLVEIYPVAKPIRPQAVLEVILQALSVTNGTNKKALDNLVGVKMQALRTLDALVICLGPNLVPFSALVFRLVMQTLRWSTENDTEDPKKIRCAAYNSLVRWLKVLHVHKPSQDSRGKLWEDELTEFVMADITPPKQVIELNVNAAIPTKNMSKKAKRKLANSMLLESSIAAHMPSEKNKVTVSEEISDEVAVAALECAETFLLSCGIFLKPTTHKLFQERLVRECYALDMYSAERGIWFLRCLDAARKSVPPSIPPPTQYCLQLYSGLLNHPQTEISQFCSQALLEIRLHLHCSPPSLTFAVEVEPEEMNKGEEKKKTISKRNREVLESLLGVGRVPSEDLETEIITIYDEPICKKMRTKDASDTDKISISSASVKSVEFSDHLDAEENNKQNERVDIEVADVEQIEDDDCIVKEIPQSVTEFSQDVIDTSENTQETDQGNKNIEKSNEEQTIENTPSNTDVVDKPSENIKETNECITKVMDPQEDTSETSIDKTDTPKDMDKDSSENVVSKENYIQATILEIEDCARDTITEPTSEQRTDSTEDTVKSINKGEQNIEKQNHEAPKENGIHSSPEKLQENGQVNVEATIVSSKSVETNDSLTVEDMLADFVDEVNEENIAEA